MPVFAAMEEAPGGMVPAEPMAMAAPTGAAAPQGGSGGAPVRVRQYFPETLYVNPLVLTGADGKATLNVTMADSITTWRLTATASDQTGRRRHPQAPLPPEGPRLAQGPVGREPRLRLLRAGEEVQRQTDLA
ncbi:MAG: hypothetical protein IV100_24380 [Myxococcales bacterium]|nr:hypothetical protein [Myxococcales bacterium]